MGKIGDIWVRLGLKKDGFDTGLKKADSDLKGFGTGVGKMGSVAGAALKGIAGAAGLALGGIEAFNRMITSNESNNDKWENTMRTMNNSVNEFFSALTSGDFTGFQNGLDGIARKARETAEALRQIEDAQTVYGLFSTENRAIFNENMVTLRNRNASPEQIEAAKKAIESVMKAQTEYGNQLAEKAVNAAKNIIAQRGNIEASDFSETDIKEMLSVALDAQGGIRSEELERQYQEYVEKFRDLNAKYIETDFYTGYSEIPEKEIENYQRELKELNGRYASANLYNALWTKTNGDDLKQLVSFLQSAYSARSEIASMQRTYQRAEQSSAALTGATAATSTPPPEGSLAYLQQKLKEAQDAAATAVGEVAQKEAMETVKSIEGQIEEMKNRIAASLRDPWEGISAVPAIPLPTRLESSSESGIVLPDIEDKTSGMEEYRSQIDETSDSIGILAGAMSNLSGLVDDQSASWMSYAGNVMQAIAQAIPAIASLTAAQSTQATMGAASAASQAGSAVAGIPVVGPAMAVAAIASVIAALAAVPKFAQGGIVGGSSYYGDKLLARVNSGEMILNTDQQRRIFNHMESPVQRVEITGRMTASGRDLQYIFDKYGDYRRQ